MNLMRAEDCCGTGVQGNETQFKIGEDCGDKLRFNLFCSCAPVVILQQIRVGFSLLFSIYLAIAGTKRLCYSTAQKQHELFFFRYHAVMLQTRSQNSIFLRVSCSQGDGLLTITAEH